MINRLKDNGEKNIGKLKQVTSKAENQDDEAKSFEKFASDIKAKALEGPKNRYFEKKAAFENKMSLSNLNQCATALEKIKTLPEYNDEKSFIDGIRIEEFHPSSNSVIKKKRNWEECVKPLKSAKIKLAECKKDTKKPQLILDLVAAVKDAEEYLEVCKKYNLLKENLSQYENELTTYKTLLADYQRQNVQASNQTTPLMTEPHDSALPKDKAQVAKQKTDATQRVVKDAAVQVINHNLEGIDTRGVDDKAAALEAHSLANKFAIPQRSKPTQLKTKDKSVEAKSTPTKHQNNNTEKKSDQDCFAKLRNCCLFGKSRKNQPPAAPAPETDDARAKLLARGFSKS